MGWKASKLSPLILVHSAEAIAIESVVTISVQSLYLLRCSAESSQHSDHIVLLHDKYKGTIEPTGSATAKSCIQ